MYKFFYHSCMTRTFQWLFSSMSLKPVLSLGEQTTTFSRCPIHNAPTVYPEHLRGEMLQACSTGRRPQDRPRTHWRDYGILLSWYGNVSVSLRKSWRGRPGLCTGTADPVTQTWISSRKWMDGWIHGKFLLLFKEWGTFISLLLLLLL